MDICKDLLAKPTAQKVAYLEAVVQDSHVGSSSASHAVSYDFPAFTELLVAVALLSPPSVFSDPIDVRVDRLKAVFGAVGLPRLDDGEEVMSPVTTPLPSWVGSSQHVNVVAETTSAMSPLLKLEAELPALPTLPRLALTNPPPGTEFAPPPLTFEEKLALKAESKKKGKKKAAGPADDEETRVHKWGEIVYHAHRPEPRETDEQQAYKRGAGWLAFQSKLNA